MSEGHGERRQGRDGQNAGQSHCNNLERLAVTPATRLFDLLWPGASSYTISKMLGARVSPAHVRMWRTGARPLPRWIRELAQARSRAINETLDTAPNGPGMQAGWRNITGYVANQKL